MTSPGRKYLCMSHYRCQKSWAICSPSLDFMCFCKWVITWYVAWKRCFPSIASGWLVTSLFHRFHSRFYRFYMKRTVAVKANVNNSTFREKPVPFNWNLPKDFIISLTMTSKDRRHLPKNNRVLQFDKYWCNEQYPQLLYWDNVFKRVSAFKLLGT